MLNVRPRQRPRRSPDLLRKVQGELIRGLELVDFNPDDRAVVRNANQQVATFGVQESGDRLEDSMGDDGGVLLLFLAGSIAGST